MADDRCSLLFPRDSGFYRPKEVAHCFPHYCLRLSRVSVSKSLMLVAVLTEKSSAVEQPQGDGYVGKLAVLDSRLPVFLPSLSFNAGPYHGHAGQIARVSFKLRSQVTFPHQEF